MHGGLPSKHTPAPEQAPVGELAIVVWLPCASKYSDADIERIHAERARRFVTDAPTSAADAAKIVLDGVRADRLRILVGPDAHIIDRTVREDPDHAYEPGFYERFATEAGWNSGR
jgi:hypothetical protein